MSQTRRRNNLDLTQGRIEAFNQANGGGVVVRKSSGGYSLFVESTGVPVARLRPVGDGDNFEVLWWSHREKWEQIGDFGGMRMPLDDALNYIARDPMDCFWH